MKTLKKFSLFAGALALALTTFSSCDKEDPAVIVEDGFYVTGDATGSSNLSINYRMASGINEVTKAKRAGMYEKYVALEANKDFTLLLKEGNVETKYSATLTEFNTQGEGDQPTVTLLRGTLVSGTAATPMKVTTSGLYHIVLDLNENNDLANPLIIVAPVEWGVRGVNGDWGWKKMKASDFNRTTMTWDTTFTSTNAGTYKFAYGGGWKIQLDDAGLVKANTNLGVDMVQGGADIDMPKGTNIKLTLTWTLAGGELSKSYAMALTGNIIIEDPSTFVVGFSGSAFGSNTNPPADWSDPSGPTLATYSATQSNITNTTTKAGTYVYNISNLKMDASKEFKVRYNGAWIGVNGIATMVGETFGGTDNFVVNTAATYKTVKFEVTWTGSKASAIKVTFTK
ncbi:MAG: hypothetical protein VB102_04700 [Paludibacter sp.]|nr:hypothetical protein [Paludibacter sp.]